MAEADWTPTHDPEGNWHMAYDRTVAAALAETKSKFALAEALAEDVPPRRPGPSEDATIADYLVEARQAIIDAGGEAKSVSTLQNYRWAALWVRADVSGNYRWLAGVSFSAHAEARQAGMSYEEFAASPMTSTEIREKTGKANRLGPPEKIAESWTPEQRAEVAGNLIREAAPDKRAEVVRDLLADPEVAEQVAGEITDYVAADPKRTAEVVSKRQQVGVPPYVPRAERDYDAMVEAWVNQASVTLAAESSGRWTPSDQSQALLYFMTQILGNRHEPTGAQADLVNDKLESLFSEVETYANSEVS